MKSDTHKISVVTQYKDREEPHPFQVEIMLNDLEFALLLESREREREREKKKTILQ